MLEFLWPWVFALAPLPFLLRKILPAKQDSSAALKVPFYQQLAQSQESKQTPLWQILLLSFIWLCLLLACARPIWIGEPVELPASGRDLLLAVDISGSMKTPDMKIENEQVTSAYGPLNPSSEILLNAANTIVSAWFYLALKRTCRRH